MTYAEVILWNRLKNKQLLGYDFDRQKPIGHYIVDFFCKDLSLAIEIDGSSHNFKRERDQFRQNVLEKLGVNFIRFWDSEVKNDLVSVIEKLTAWIEENSSKSSATGQAEISV